MRSFNLQARQTAQKLHALGVDGAIDEESRASGSANTATSADLDPRQKRGSTIPSIQEFLDAIKKVHSLQGMAMNVRVPQDVTDAAVCNTHRTRTRVESRRSTNP